MGAFAGLFDRPLRPVSVGCASVTSDGLRDLVLGLSLGAGDLVGVRAAAFFGLWLRARTGLLTDVSRSRLVGLFAGLFDREAARPDGLATRPVITRSSVQSTDTGRHFLAFSRSWTASSTRIDGISLRGMSVPRIPVVSITPRLFRPVRMAVPNQSTLMPASRQSSSPVPRRLRIAFLTLRYVGLICRVC